MPHDSSSNAPSSAATSTSAPATPRNESLRDPRSEREAAAQQKEAASLGESAFLAKQSADAQAAISRVVSDIQHDLATTVDPRAWMQVHPWATLGAAAVAGFVAAHVMVPSEEERALKRLKKIEEALMPTPPAPTNGDTVDPRARRGGGFLSGLAGQVLMAVQPVLMSAITAGVTAKTVKEDTPTGGNPPAPQGAPEATGGDPGI